MTDNVNEEPQVDAEAATAVADAEPTPPRLNQQVQVRDVGPCKKHITVTIDRTDIDNRIQEKYGELTSKGGTYIAGFRPGKAPRKLVERTYQKEVFAQLRGEMLMASLEQLADEEDIAPLAPPNLDPSKIFIPEKGPMVYEFEVEVRPEFELPSYKGLKLKKPVQDFTDADVETERKRLMEPYGQVIPKSGDNPAVELNDIIFVDITTKHDGKVLNEVKDVRIRVDPKLAMKDGVADDFGKVMAGAKVGDTRIVDIKVSDSVASPELRGQTVKGELKVNDIKVIRMPELTDELLDQFGVKTPEQLDEAIRVILNRRLEYIQRQSARQQVISLLADATMKEVPQDLLIRQARRAMSRKVLEMKSAGMSEDEINARQRLLQQDVIRSTTLALKEHFVLQKIAELEDMDVTDDEIDDEIVRIADRNNESPRKVRARLEREDLIESLAAEMLETKALDLVLDNAEFEEYKLNAASDEHQQVATVEEQIVPGEMQELKAEEPEVEEAEEEKK